MSATSSAASRCSLRAASSSSVVGGRPADDLPKLGERAEGRWGDDDWLSCPVPLLGVGSADEGAGSGGGCSLASAASNSSGSPSTLCGTCSHVEQSGAGQMHRAVRVPYGGKSEQPCASGAN